MKNHGIASLIATLTQNGCSVEGGTAWGQSLGDHPRLGKHRGFNLGGLQPRGTGPRAQSRNPSRGGGGCGTLLSFAISPAKNWERLATLKTMWKVKFLPTLMIPWHLEVWPAAPDTLSSI